MTKYHIVRIENQEGRLVAVSDYLTDAIDMAEKLTFKTGVYHLVEVHDGGKH
jgi:hypothetical protein